MSRCNGEKDVYFNKLKANLSSYVFQLNFRKYCEFKLENMVEEVVYRLKSVSELILKLIHFYKLTKMLPECDSVQLLIILILCRCEECMCRKECK